MPTPNASRVYPRLCSSMDAPKNDRTTLPSLVEPQRASVLDEEPRQGFAKNPPHRAMILDAQATWHPPHMKPGMRPCFARVVLITAP
jgi:hypothetical protein